MKLQTKLALYNAVSKAVIIAAIGILLPILLQRVVYNHIDQRLKARANKMMLMVQRGGISDVEGLKVVPVRHLREAVELAIA